MAGGCVSAGIRSDRRLGGSGHALIVGSGVARLYQAVSARPGRPWGHRVTAPLAPAGPRSGCLLPRLPLATRDVLVDRLVLPAMVEPVVLGQFGAAPGGGAHAPLPVGPIGPRELTNAAPAVDRFL